MISLCLVIVTLASCQSSSEKGQAVLNLAALSAFPVDYPVEALAKSDTLIDVELPPNARIEELAPLQLAQLKAAAFRFYSHVTLVDGQYQVQLPQAADIHVSAAVVDAYKSAIDNINQYSDSLKQAGQEINLPEITDAYRQMLLQ